MSLFSSNDENYQNPTEEYHIDRHYADDKNRFEPENEYGNVEYKLRLVNPTSNRLERLVSQLKWRIREGQGVAVVVLGVQDDGRLVGLTPDECRQSMETLNMMAERISATTHIVHRVLVQRPLLASCSNKPSRKRPAPTHITNNACSSQQSDNVRQVLEVIVRKNTRHDLPDELRAAVLGPSDSGKSTLLGVLSHSELDNGRGSSRLNLFRHRHEIKSGHTSSISQEVFGFTSQGEPLTYNLCLSTEELIESADRLISLIDLAGHQRYLSTTLFGLGGHSPDIVMLVVNAASSISSVTYEHISIALGMGNLLVTVINKIDLISPEERIVCCQKLERILTAPHLARSPLRITDTELAIHASHNMRFEHSKLAPIFFTSCVSGEGLPLLHEFLFRLAKCWTHLDSQQIALNNPAELQVDETFTVPGTGTVVSGLVVNGVIREGDCLLLGPDDRGSFNAVTIISVQRYKVACSLAKAGQFCTVAIKPAVNSSSSNPVNQSKTTNNSAKKMNAINSGASKLVNECGSNVQCKPRKGMVLRAPESDWAYSFPICMYFQARIEAIVNHHHRIRAGTQVSVYTGTVRQTCKIVSINGSSASHSWTSLKPTTTDPIMLVFKFIKRPEYVRPNSKLIFRHGLAKGIGSIVRVYNYAETRLKSTDSIIETAKSDDEDDDDDQQD